MKHATLRNEKLPNPGLAASAGGGSGENQEPLFRFRNIRPRNFPAYPGFKSSTTHTHTHTHVDDLVKILSLSPLRDDDVH